MPNSQMEQLLVDVDEERVTLGMEVMGGVMLDLRNPEVIGYAPSISLADRAMDAACWRLRAEGLTEAEIAAGRILAVSTVMDHEDFLAGSK